MCVPVIEGHQNGVGGGLGGDAVGQPEGRQRRGPVRLPGDVSEATHRFGQRAEPGAAGVGAELTETGHSSNDEPRIDLA